MPQTEQYRFGPFHLDVPEHELRRNTQVITLTPKAFDPLLILVQGVGRTFTKAELLESLWPGRIVEENNLSQTIFQLRKALAENADGSNYILTVPRRGYKFIGSVSRHNVGDNDSGPQEAPGTAHGETVIVAGDLPPAESVSSPVNTRGRWRLPIAALVASVAVCVAGGFAWQRMRITPVTDKDALVLADFTNATGDPVFDGTLR